MNIENESDLPTAIIFDWDDTLVDNWESINSALNIKTKDLNVLGVPEISISDSQRVYMYPKNGRIVIKKNRDFSYN